MEAGFKMTCPFCGFQDESDYQMLLHVEIQHSEDGESPFMVKDAPAASVSEPISTAATHLTHLARPSTPLSTYVDCPHECGERISSSELQSHVDFHVAENMALDDAGLLSEVQVPTGSRDDDDDDDNTARQFTDNFDTKIAAPIRNHGSIQSRSSNSSRGSRTTSLKELFFKSHRRRTPAIGESTEVVKVKQLGRAELGPYAHEKRMPAWLQKMLENDGRVSITNTIGPNGSLVRVETVVGETSGLVDVLARLSLLDRSIVRAFYCGPEVRHIAKMAREGGFCGYRNIQMLVSYIRGARASGYKNFTSRVPSILTLQDMIENAWDMGYNSTGRIETGGIKLTRKYIGTPEAQALFASLGIACEIIAVGAETRTEAFNSLMRAICDYFDNGTNTQHRVVITDRPPIYFQHKGHSMTIVGVEVSTDGTANLVCFDPMFSPSSLVKKLIKNDSFRCSNPATILKAYRRGESYLMKYKEFELLKLGTSAASTTR